MSDSTRKYLIVVILLLVTAFASFGAYSIREHSGALYTHDIPMIIGSWYGKDLPVGERIYEILETKDMFMREYVNSNNEKVLFTVVFAQNNRKIAHPPEVCLAGGGWSRTDRDIQTLAIGSRTVKMNLLTLQKGDDKQAVLYSYRADRDLTPSYYVQQLKIILNGMLRRKTNSALISMSSFTTGNDVKDAVARVRKFAQEAIPILEEYLP